MKLEGRNLTGFETPPGHELQISKSKMFGAADSVTLSIHIRALMLEDGTRKGEVWWPHGADRDDPKTWTVLRIRSN